jgi:hypothetical protein
MTAGSVQGKFTPFGGGTGLIGGPPAKRPDEPVVTTRPAGEAPQSGMEREMKAQADTIHDHTFKTRKPRAG